jgi:hypothetical protein
LALYSALSAFARMSFRVDFFLASETPNEAVTFLILKSYSSINFLSLVAIIEASFSVVFLQIIKNSSPPHLPISSFLLRLSFSSLDISIKTLSPSK